jgi:hypothetical protein
MYWITTETATQDHEFTDGDGTDLIPATDFNALWCNTIQRELLNILAGLEIAPNAANFAQIWDALKMIGIRVVYSNGNVATNKFDGSTVIFHDVSNFNIDTLKTKAVLVVVPLWAENSAAEITFHYGSQKHKIKKGFFYIGMVANGSVDGLLIVGIDLPRAFNGKDLMIGTLNADEVKATSRYEKQLVRFEYSDEIDSSGVEKWRSWQLMANWKVGQVKRVYCVSPNATQTVFVYYDRVANPKMVTFQENGFLEFLCIGTRSVVVDGVTYNYAVLLVNGRN